MSGKRTVFNIRLNVSTDTASLRSAGSWFQRRGAPMMNDESPAFFLDLPTERRVWSEKERRRRWQSSECWLLCVVTRLIKYLGASECRHFNIYTTKPCSGFSVSLEASVIPALTQQKTGPYHSWRLTEHKEHVLRYYTLIILRKVSMSLIGLHFVFNYNVL